MRQKSAKRLILGDIVVAYAAHYNLQRNEWILYPFEKNVKLAFARQRMIFVIETRFNKPTPRDAYHGTLYTFIDVVSLSGEIFRCLETSIFDVI